MNGIQYMILFFVVFRYILFGVVGCLFGYGFFQTSYAACIGAGSMIMIAWVHEYWKSGEKDDEDNHP